MDELLKRWAALAPDEIRVFERHGEITAIDFGVICMKPDDPTLHLMALGYCLSCADGRGWNWSIDNWNGDPIAQISTPSPERDMVKGMAQVTAEAAIKAYLELLEAACASTQQN